MFQNDYRREMDGLTPSPAAMERLNRLLEDGTSPQTAPRRRLGRRAAVALALCAALAVSAVAAGPGLMDALEAHLGSYAPFAVEVAGSVVDQGIRLELLEAVTDGYTTRVYYTLTDETGDRLNGHTQVRARLEGTVAAMGWSSGNRVVSYDGESRTLLVEASVEGIDTSQPVTLEVTRLDPAYRSLDSARFQPPASAEPLETETTAEGDVVLKAGQTPQTSPDTKDISISSMGFDGSGNFHIRLALAEGSSAESLRAVPCGAGGEQMGATLKRAATADGVDCVLGGIAPEDVADMESIRVYGAYRGPEAVIEGDWSLPLELEQAEQKTILVGRTLEDGFYVDRIEVSGMNIAIYYRGGDKSWFTVWATDQAGVQTGVPLGMMSAGAENGLNLGLWTFDTPMDLDDIASVTLLGETFPLW